MALRSPPENSIPCFPKRPVPLPPTAVSMLSKRLFISAIVLLGAMGTVFAAERGLLSSVVQVCVTNYQLTGASFPCLEVNTAQGASRGFVTIRAPLARTHIIVCRRQKSKELKTRRFSHPTPRITFRCVGSTKICDRGGAASDQGGRYRAGDKFAAGRSQDQLHIHVDCLRRRYAQLLRLHNSALRSDRWSRLPFAFRGRYYWALLLNSADLSQTNVFRTAATLCKRHPAEWRT